MGYIINEEGIGKLGDNAFVVKKYHILLFFIISGFQGLLCVQVKIN